ncbi:MAG: hypothetical protein AAF170_07005 [Bacteroidota bacterium]
MIRSLLLLAAIALAIPASSQTFVVNQGNFSDGNGSVTVVPSDLMDSATQLYEGQLGSILQSATQVGDKLYLLSNSANRIDVVDVPTQARVGQIGGDSPSPFSSPRYMEVASSDGVYVSNQVYFGGNPSYVLPLTLSGNGGTVGDAIPVDGLPEGMALLGDSLYVALGTFGPGSGVDSLAVIDARQNELAGYIDIDCYARFIVSDQQFNVVAFCEDTDELVVIDQETRSVKQRLAFGEEIGDPSGVGRSLAPGRINIAVRSATPSASSYLVITASGVAEVSGDTQEGAYAIERTVAISDADTTPISAVGSGGGGPYLYLGRPDPANPFTADGTITVHDYNDGSILATYPAGIYPVHIPLDETFGTAAEQGAAARALNLELAGPNPARGASALAFTLRQPEDARVTVHDLLGRTVATVADRGFSAGDQRVELDVSGLAPGPYRVRLAVGDRIASLPLTVVR